MAYEIKQVDSTPNPRARKLIVEPAPGSIRSFFKPDDAQGDPLGEAIFEVEGVTNVLIHTAFISVSIASGQNWKAMLPKLRKALKGVPAP
ncbi:MAG: NifU N-terminal domain-containing protein [Phycisphaerales bacterium JB052]